MIIRRYCRITNICSNHNSSIHPKISWASKQGHFHPYGYRSDSQFVTYRTSDYQAPAAYRSVCTSVCTVCEVKTYKDFADEDAFVKYTNRYSVFNERELRNWYKNKNYFTVIKMVYNIAFTKKVINKVMKEQVGLRPNYWGFFKMTDVQFDKTLELGETTEVNYDSITRYYNLWFQHTRGATFFI